MKRSPINRSDPDVIREWQRRGVEAAQAKARDRERKALPARSSRKRESDRLWASTRKAVHERSGGRCEARAGEWCEGAEGSGQHVHHVLPRSRGGKDDGSTPLLDTCLRCHGWIHAHPYEAGERGWLV